MPQSSPVEHEPTPLHLEGWVRVMEETQGLRAERVAFSRGAGPDDTIDGLFFLDRAGRIRVPDGLPYLALAPRRSDRAHQLSDPFPPLLEAAEYVARRRLFFGVSLMPGWLDVRPWQWRGIMAFAAYTFVLPFQSAPRPGRTIDRRIRRAQDAGYSCRYPAPLDDAISCVRATEIRNGFLHGIRLASLRALVEALGPEHLRIYASYDRNGDVASSTITLHRAGSAAIGLMAGTSDAHLDSGATQLLQRYELDDLARAGADRFDFGGGNLPSIARYKASWHGQLTPTFALQQPGLRSAITAFRRHPLETGARRA